MLRRLSVTTLSLLALGCTNGAESLDPSEALVRRFSIGEAPETSTAGLLYKPSSVALDNTGSIYVADAGNHRIAVYSADGEFTREIGRAGEGPGEFRANRSVYVDVKNRHLAVLERTTARIHLFSTDGSFLTSIASRHPINGVSVADSKIYAYTLVDGARNAQIHVYTATGELVEVYESGLISAALNSAELYPLNSASIAAADGGVVAQAYLHWPLLRIVKAGVKPSDNWFDFSWLADRELRRRFARPRSLLTDPNLTMHHEEMRPVVFYDLEYVHQYDIWIALLWDNVIQVFSGTGEPRQVLRLDVAGEEHRIRDIGIDPTGRRLCAVDVAQDVVYCFAPTESVLEAQGQTADSVRRR